MYIVVEGNAQEVAEIFGGEYFVAGAIYSVLNGTYRVEEWQRGTIHSSLGFSWSYKITLTSVPEFKSQEEVVAEAAVRKAKESLEAAEATLKKIKEKK
jgi:hypothetical protein